jgi:hypothetical protein
LNHEYIETGKSDATGLKNQRMRSDATPVPAGAGNLYEKSYLDLIIRNAGLTQRDDAKKKIHSALCDGQRSHRDDRSKLQ